MQPFPHTYRVSATAGVNGPVSIMAAGVPTIASAPPVEFGGPGDKWSPESLLCAAIADCYILTFRSLARSEKIEWLKLDCRVEGKLERVDGRTQFTHFVTYVDLKVPVATDIELMNRLLEKAEHGCLIANSLCGGRSLETLVQELNLSAIEKVTA
jgi:organic hydroperoxide reductase OsmC/OhrA